ncbi:MAG: hypothetical protein P8I55_12330 [Crocinitomix sp.]|nr:hypothetical protein [Crocinitomix sp.]
MKKQIKNILIKTGLALLTIYVTICTVTHFAQEKIIFHPQKLDPGFPFYFAPLKKRDE